MGWPNEKAVKAAAVVLDEVHAIGPEGTVTAGRMLAAAGLPELVGSTDTAKLLGVESSNLSRVSGLPEPLYTLRGGRLYDADEIRALAASRRAAA